MNKLLLPVCIFFLMLATACTRSEFAQDIPETNFSNSYAYGEDSIPLPDINDAFVGVLAPNPPFPGRYALINGGFSGSTSTKGYKFGDKVTVSINNPILVLGDSMSIFSSWSIFHSRNGNIEPIINNSSTQDNTVSTQNSSIFDSVFTYTIQAGDAGTTVLFQPNLVIVPKNKWPVTVISADTTMGTVSGSGNYCKQSPFSIHAFPNPGYVFHQWEFITEGSEPSTTSLSETETQVMLTDEKPVTIKAHFRYENKAIVTVSSDGHGSVSGGGVIPINTPFTISATPAPGYEFDYWTKDGTWISDNPNYTTTVTTNDPVTFIAYFKESITTTFNVSYMVDMQGFESQSTIEYTDPSGQGHVETLTPITHSYNVKQGSNVRISIQLNSYYSDIIYCMYKAPDGSIRDMSANTSMIVDYFDYENASGENNVIIRAETFDFREEFQ